MAKIDVPRVPTELWQVLLEQLVEFRRVVPWQWMPDSAIGAYVDAAGQPWSSCVLGNARQVFGLALYRGANGMRLHRVVQQLGNSFEVSEVRHMHDPPCAAGPESGAHTETVPHLAAAAEFRAGLEAHTARGSRRKR